MTDPDQDPEDAPEEETEYVKNATGALAWMAKNPVAANLIMLLLLVGGAIMLKAIRQEVFPGFELDLVLVNVGYPGASPDEVEQGVVLAIEESIRGLDGIKEIRSTASEGVAVVAVELVEGTETDRALADIKASVDRITSFPEDIERPVVSLAAIHRGVIDLVLYGDQPEASLRALAEQARSDLLADPNITYVELGGIRPREISIEIPQSQLREYGLTLEGVAQTIRASSVELPAGGIKTNAGEILLRTDERREMGQEFGDIVLRSLPDGTQLRVQDVAQIHDGFQDNDQVYTFDGKPAVSVKVYRVGDETPIAVADAVEKYAKDLEERLPDTVQIAATNDRSKMYRARIDLLMRNARTGLILVLLILGLFLELRLAFWVTMGIPISFIG
ncbi:MAG: efflux RND transporter permease subunit, partial [Myxococcales bacterium]|nr:efflux RND transporter permease subunit [Myxococcales bacterium]